MSALLPSGITNLADLPYPIHEAIVAALGFLQFEELPSDERPPRSMYLRPQKLADFFKAVNKRRDEKYGTTTDGSRKEIDDPVQNDAAKALIVGDPD